MAEELTTENDRLRGKLEAGAKAKTGIQKKKQKI